MNAAKVRGALQPCAEGVAAAVRGGGGCSRAGVRVRGALCARHRLAGLSQAQGAAALRAAEEGVRCPGARCSGGRRPRPAVQTGGSGGGSSPGPPDDKPDAHRPLPLALRRAPPTAMPSRRRTRLSALPRATDRQPLGHALARSYLPYPASSTCGEVERRHKSRVHVFA